MRVQAILLVVAAVLGLLWVVALGGDGQPALLDDVGGTADPGPAVSETALGADGSEPAQAGLAPRPAPAGAREAPRASRLRPAARPRVVPPSKATRQIQGRVVDARGARIEGAVVYQLGKQAPKGKDGSKVPRAITDAEGAFIATVEALPGTWLCATKQGHAGAFLDGNALDPDTFLRVVLPDPLELVVVLVDAQGKPVVNEPVQVVPTRHRGPPAQFPGPEANAQEQFEFTGEDGTVRFRFDRSLPVLVAPKPEGASVTPRDVYLAVPEGRLEFVTAPAVTIRVRTTSQVDAPGITAGVWLTIHDDAGAVVAHDTAAPVDGAYETVLPLAPGSYVLQFSTRHFEPQVAPLEIPRGGETVEVEVERVPLERSAILELAGPAGGTIAFARRLDGEHARLGWQRANATGRPPTLTLRPGEHQLVLMDTKEERVAVLRTTLRPGDSEKAVLRWRPGVAVPLADVLPEGVAVRSLRVHAPGYGFMPVAGRRGAERAPLLSEEAVLHALGGRGADGIVLGPYPGRGVSLHVTDWEGREYVESVR